MAGGDRGLRDRPTEGRRVQDPGAGRPRGTADSRAAHGRHRPARRLAVGAESRGLRPGRADRLAGRGPADLPAARGAGPALRHHHRPQRPGQRGGHRIRARHHGFRRRQGQGDVVEPARPRPGPGHAVAGVRRPAQPRHGVPGDQGLGRHRRARRRVVPPQRPCAARSRRLRPTRRDRLRQRDAGGSRISEPAATQPQHAGAGERTLAVFHAPRTD